MTIWVDADACPGVIKEILVRAAERTRTATVFIANRNTSLPNSRYLKSVTVSAGFDVADNEIVRRAEAGDIVITSDIPLAAEVIAKGAQVISHRGELYTKDSIRARLSMRDFMESLRSSGVQTGGPPALELRDRKSFADCLDKLLAQN